MLRLTPGTNLGLLFIWAVMAFPAAAHTVGISGDVAATFHITPNHNPKAGKSTQAWFALTRKGGQPIPLSQCNCQLLVYSKPRSQKARPLLTPPLRAISAEQYRGIPGADIVFPTVGAYELELKGTAKSGARFRPFTLNYTVNVGS
ncbi:MAG TPA: hypothetical protein V6D26_18130 [Stenomitos sp.]